MSARRKDLVVLLDVNQVRGGYSAATDLGGNPLCLYGESEDEAIRKAIAAVFRFLASTVERGRVDVGEVTALRFKIDR